jgi:hypothetical protein
MSPEGTCRGAFASIQAFCAQLGLKSPRGDESTYCKARQRLDDTVLDEILTHSAAQLEAGTPGGRRAGL